MRRTILSSVDCQALQYFSAVTIKGYDFQKYVLIFSTAFSEILLIPRKIQPDIINVRRSKWRSSLRVCGQPLAETEDSNPTRDMDVFLL
jgi:hypothetical protein